MVLLVVVEVVGMRLQIIERRSFRNCGWWAHGPVSVQTTTEFARGRCTGPRATDNINASASSSVIKVHSVLVLLLLMFTVPQQRLLISSG